MIHWTHNNNSVFTEKIRAATREEMNALWSKKHARCALCGQEFGERYGPRCPDQRGEFSIREGL